MKYDTKLSLEVIQYAVKILKQHKSKCDSAEEAEDLRIIKKMLTLLDAIHFQEKEKDTFLLGQAVGVTKAVVIILEDK